jgi:hypothetical protein
MLKILTTGAVIAAVLNPQVNDSLLSLSQNVAHQTRASNLVVTTNNQTELTHAQTSRDLPDSSHTPEVVEQIEPTGIMLGLLVLGSVAIVINLSQRNANDGLRPAGGDRSISIISRKSETDSILQQASRRLRQKLLTLLHNDWDAANRLLAKVKTKNPHKSNDWYVEKVIYDLERDRA